jgi:hypothetical protein
MKSYKSILAAVVCSAIASVAITASAQDTKQGFITVARVEGIATYSLGAGQPEMPLVAGKYLAPGSIIFTKDNAIVDIVLGKEVNLPQAKWAPDRISPAADSPVRGLISYSPSTDQNAIRITPNSALAIDKLRVADTGADTVSDTELDLKQGRIFASVRKLSGASQYIVKLPNGVAGVRGTLFSIGADGSVACYESTGGGVILALTFDGGATKTFLVEPGQSFSPGSTSPTPLSPEVLHDLSNIFKALRTSYYAAVSFDFDHTQTHITPTSGIF